MNQILEHISNYNIENFTNAIFQYGEINNEWDRLIIPVIVSAILSGGITFLINLLNTKNVERQALYQKKYEFWLDFSKDYFTLQPFLKYMLRRENLTLGIITLQSEEEIKKSYRDWLIKWKNFYKKVVGNEKIYLEPEGINMLIVNAFFTAFKNNLETLEIVKNKGNIETFSIKPDSLKKIIRDAKNLFELNLDINSKLAEKYLKFLDNYTNIKDKNEKLTYNQMREIVDNLSDNAFIDIVLSDINETEQKLEKIVCVESITQKAKRNFNNYFGKSNRNQLKKWLNKN